MQEYPESDPAFKVLTTIDVTLEKVEAIVKGNPDVATIKIKENAYPNIPGARKITYEDPGAGIVHIFIQSPETGKLYVGPGQSEIDTLLTADAWNSRGR